MTNEINYFPGAKWAAVNGAFTAEELRDIADKIENPELQEEPEEKEEE